jgi:hypothetical protein
MIGDTDEKVRTRIDGVWGESGAEPSLRPADGRIPNRVTDAATA